jgi:transposase
MGIGLIGQSCMSTRLVNIDRNTPMLLPPDLRDWVREDDLVHFVIDAVALLDVSAARVNQRGTGCEQYPPGMMLSLLIYSYAQGIFSSRQIERATFQHLSVRYLTADTHPDHDTIAKFRRENAELIRSVFVQLLRLAQASGVLRLGTVALDGTKIAAAAAKRRNVTYEQLQAEISELNTQVDGLLEQAEQADHSANVDDQLPSELTRAQTRRARLAAAKAELERQVLQRSQDREKQREDAPPGCKRSRLDPQPSKEDRINLSDSDSTLTRTRSGFIQGYNAQCAMSVESGLIVAADVVRDTNDRQQLHPMVNQVVHNVGTPHHVLVDTDYENVSQLQTVEAATGTQVLCPPRRSDDVNPRARQKQWRLVSKAYREQMRQRLATEAGKALYRLRQSTVEPGFGIIKAILGFRSFRVRGLDAVRNEWSLISLAFNCRRLAKRAA